MLVMVLGIVMESRLLHPEKVPLPMLVTLLGIVMEVRLLQPPKAANPMFVTLLGIVMEVRPLQFEYLQLIVHQLVLVETVEKC